MRAVAALVCFAFLAGCGAKSSATSRSTAATPSTGANSGCAPQDSPHEGAPYDIIGLRLGMSPSQVKSRLKCANRQYGVGVAEVIPDNANWNIQFPQSSSNQNSITALAGSVNLPPYLGQSNGPPSPDQTQVKFLGLPGREKAYVIDRVVMLTGASMPSISTVKSGLIGKYGQPTNDTEAAIGSELHWIFDPNGVAIASTDNRDQDCVINLRNRMGAENCGLTIVARISILNDGSKRVNEIDVSMIDESTAMQEYKDENAAILKIVAPTGTAPKL